MDGDRGVHLVCAYVIKSTTQSRLNSLVDDMSENRVYAMLGIIDSNNDHLEVDGVETGG